MNHLSCDMEKNCAYRLFIITDGYFDFESSAAQKKQGNRTTTSNFLNVVQGKTNWKEWIEKHDVCIIPHSGLSKIKGQIDSFLERK